MLAFAALQFGCSHRSEAVNADASAPAAVVTDGAAAAPAKDDQPTPAETSGPSVDDPAELACVDRWLEAKQFDRYGSPAGTMYAGGTPLFDERTGTSTNRLDFVYGRHAEAKAACRPDAGGPAQGAPAKE